MAFRAGQKVVCVDDNPASRYGSWNPIVNLGLDGLTKGRVYTVRECGVYRGVPCLFLCEINRRATRFGVVGFAAERFRPAVERSTDISVFRALLKRTPQKETA